MRKNLTEIVFILDRSGSMSGLETDTIGGFNSMIEKQKKENGEALISTVLFDNVSEVIHDRVPVQKVEPMTDRDYSVRGCTALLDAIGGAIHHIGNVHKYRKEDLKTTSFDVQTRYENVKDRQGNYKREFVGYACSYRLKLAFDFDSKQLAKVISAIADCGAKPELSIAFTVRNPSAVSEKLLISATENARAKAEILCKASGSTLGQLLNIDYNWGELNVYSRTSYEVEDCIQPLMAMSKCSAPEIEPDDIDVSDTVAFTWEIQ